MQDFTFERLAEEDLPFLLEVRNDCRNMLHDNRVFTLGECQAWFRDRQPEFYVVRYQGERVGYFRVSNRRVEDRSAYVGADLHKDFRGRGLARPAYHAFLVMLRDEQHIAVARLEVLSHNALAYGLYQKLGFIETERKNCVAVRDGASVDSIVMSKVLASESE